MLEVETRPIPTNVNKAIGELVRSFPDAKLYAAPPHEIDSPNIEDGYVTLDLPSETTAIYSKGGELKDAYLPPTGEPQETEIPRILTTLPLSLSRNIKALTIRINENGEHTDFNFEIDEKTLEVSGAYNHYWLQVAEGLALRYGLGFIADQKGVSAARDDAMKSAFSRLIRNT
jgi:hypothetical protein